MQQLQQLVERLTWAFEGKAQAGLPVEKAKLSQYCRERHCQCACQLEAVNEWRTSSCAAGRVLVNLKLPMSGDCQAVLPRTCLST